jgi:hypothetical protein
MEVERDMRHQQLLAQHLTRAEESLKNTRHLTNKQRKQFRNAMATALSSLSETALERVEKHLHEYRWYRNHEEVTAEYHRMGGTDAEIAAFYDSNNGIAHLDGYTPDELANAYAHELMHAVDGKPGQELSATKDWLEAWRSEMGKSKHVIDERSKSQPEEARAELGQRGCTGDRAVVEKRFPKCVEVWKKHGLWPKS